MPKAIITIDDHDDGDMSLSLFLERGFQVDSNSHQCANLLIKHLQEMGDVKHAGEVRELTGEEAQAVIDEAQRMQNIAHGLPEPLDGAPVEEESHTGLVSADGRPLHHSV